MAEKEKNEKDDMSNNMAVIENNKVLNKEYEVLVKGTGTNIMPLSAASPGRSYFVLDIRGGQNVNKRLSSMGIIKNETVKVLNQTVWGPMTIIIKGVRVALGRGIAAKIFVSEINEK